MTLPSKPEAQRTGLAILSAYVYDGMVAAAAMLVAEEEADHEMVYAIAVYYLRALGEYVQLAARDHECSMAEVLEGMGRRILINESTEEP
jgi:dTDP-glucose pyrophosphorylase